jgi:hypothetical protein
LILLNANRALSTSCDGTAKAQDRITIRPAPISAIADVM